MIKITLKDGNVMEFDKNTSVGDVCKEISMGLYRIACAGKLNGEVVDLRKIIDNDATLEILTFDDKDGKKAYWHTASHILAQAVKRLYRGAKLAIGPAIDNGFYYDFEVEKPFTGDDLEKIEAEMKKIIKEKAEITLFSYPKNEALELMNDEPYKIELINDIPDGEEISFYKQGDFIDLCAGPHLMVAAVKAFKLTSATGAFWRGDETKQMLCRVYGTAYPKTSDLEEYLEAVEEAKRRDHNKIGRELEFFTTSELIGQGLPILLPKGAKVIQILQRFVEDEEERRGYLLTKTPLMAKSDLYKISGHWDHYYDGMFVLGDRDKSKAGAEVLALRPMTCPFQFQAYLNRARSYRDLPIRYNETSTLFRNEASGEMHGLIRLRQFTISEGHIACRLDQVEEEFRDCFELASFMLEAVGLAGDVTYRFSKWDENDRDKYMGSKEDWEKCQDLIRNILDNIDVEYDEVVGEAAFYGPKLDIQIKNVYGKEDTIITIQIDFQLAEVFGMTYVDKNDLKKHPYVIHRTSIGCYERTLALIIEKYAGALPLWLSPLQVAVLPITDNQHEYAESVANKLRKNGIRVLVDKRNEKIGYKIRESQLDKTPYMLVVGEREASEGAVSVRRRSVGDVGAQTVDEFVARIKDEVEKRVNE